MSTSHFVLFPIPSWGHTRPFCVLATRLVHEQENVIVTFIAFPHVLEKTRTEISRQFINKSWDISRALQRIRILSPSLSDLNAVEQVEVTKLIGHACPATYRILYQAEPITCSVTGTTFNAVPAPCAAIVDLMALPQLHAIRAVSGRSVPIIAFKADGAGAIIRFYGPKSLGGVGNIGAEIDAEAARTGLSVDEVGHKVLSCAHAAGKLVQIPGHPEMYDYEFFPQKLPPTVTIHKIIAECYTFFQECDAIIVSTSYAYESVTLEAMKQGFSDMQKEVHVLGPLLPAGYGTEIQNTEEGMNYDIETFLSEMLVQHGKRSLFYVSFGTVVWHLVSEYLDELIEALVEKKVPFIFANANARGKLSEQQIERIKSSGLGMSTTWCPQQFILNHPATGWCVMHGGFNTTIESLGSGIPLICWPFAGDQPVAAAHLTENLNVAFELFQVRTGEALKPVYRNGITPAGTREAVGIEIRQIIDLCRSEKGQELRRNAEKFIAKFAKAWEEDGIARQALRNFLHQYV